MVTLKDVAKDAGVSIATVSCCISGAKAVKPETKRRIEESIEKLNYIPNAAARNLKLATSNRIGVVLTDMDDSYHAEIFKGISIYLQNQGYSVNVVFTGNSPDVECEKIDELIHNNIVGLILITSQPQHTEFFQNRIERFQIPIVFLDRRPMYENVNFAGFDNYKAALHITKELLRSGFKHIAAMIGSPQYTSEFDVVKGYTEALGYYPKEWIQYTNSTKEDAFRTIMDMPDLEKLEAIITTSEKLAEGILEGLKVKGIQVPQELQVIAFGEESWNQSGYNQQLVLTSRTAFTLGMKGAELLVGKIQTKTKEKMKPQSIILEDNVIDEPLKLAKPIRKKRKILNLEKEPLRILLPELYINKPLQALAEQFIRYTEIPLEFHIVSHDELLQEIIWDHGKIEHFYDMYLYDVPWLEYMVQNEYVADISEFIHSKSFHAEYLFEENLGNCQCNDKFYGVPLIGGSQILFYRKDLFENREIRKNYEQSYGRELKTPRTWEEFNEIAAFFTKKTNPNSPTEYGTAIAGSMEEELGPELLIRLWAYGGDIWDKYSRVSLKSLENVKAIQSVLETIKYTEKNPLEKSIQETVQDFCEGKTAMLITYTEYANVICKSIQSQIIGRVGADTIPGRSPTSIGWNLGVHPNTSRTEEIFTFFKWLCRKDISIYLTILDGQSPVKIPYQSQELLKLYPWMALTEENFRHTRKRNGPYKKKSLVIPPNAIEGILCTTFKNVVQQGMEVEVALEQGHEEMKKLFRTYGYPTPLHFLMS